MLDFGNNTRMNLRKDRCHNLGKHTITKVRLNDDLVDLPEFRKLRHLCESKITVALSKSSNIHEEKVSIQHFHDSVGALITPPARWVNRHDCPCIGFCLWRA